LWWTKWHSNRFSPSTSALPANHQSMKYSISVRSWYSGSFNGLSTMEPSFTSSQENTKYDLKDQVFFTYLHLPLIHSDLFIYFSLSLLLTPSITPPSASIFVSAIYFPPIHSALEKSPFKGPLFPCSVSTHFPLPPIGSLRTIICHINPALENLPFKETVNFSLR
jgi:hypothetical protein